MDPQGSPNHDKSTKPRTRKISQSQGCKKQFACWNQNGTILSHRECPPNNKNPANPEKSMEWVKGLAWILQNDVTKTTLFRNSACVHWSVSWQMNWKVTNPLITGSFHSWLAWERPRYGSGPAGGKRPEGEESCKPSIIRAINQRFKQLINDVVSTHYKNESTNSSNY